MFRCENEFCGNIVEAGQPVNRIVTEFRRKEYRNDVVKWGKIVDVKESYGTEIVKEIAVCPKCFQKLTGKKPKLIMPKAKVLPLKDDRFNSRPPRRKKWQNPRAKKELSSTSKGTHSRENQQNNSSSSVARKKPIVEKVNPIPLIKE